VVTQQIFTIEDLTKSFTPLADLVTQKLGNKNLEELKLKFLEKFPDSNEYVWKTLVYHYKKSFYEIPMLHHEEQMSRIDISFRAFTMWCKILDIHIELKIN
jgi:2-hydroxy-3-keto-5-methylthiopentenyl-1-phosphate phosphatase